MLVLGVTGPIVAVKLPVCALKLVKLLKARLPPETKHPGMEFETVTVTLAEVCSEFESVHVDVITCEPFAAVVVLKITE